MLVSVDVYRPAAREQLKIVAKQVETRLYEGDQKGEPAGTALVERLCVRCQCKDIRTEKPDFANYMTS